MELQSRTRVRRSGESGFSLLETMVGLTLLAILAASVLPLALIATTTNENTGHLSSRSAEYAQDKLEQLQALSYSDSTSDTRQFPAPELGGSGLTIGGSINPNAPAALYADYLDFEGALIPSPNGAPPDGWYYQRLWPNLKQITVMATIRNSMGFSPMTPRATLTALKSSPF